MPKHCQVEIGESVVMPSRPITVGRTVKFGVSCGKPSRFTLALRCPAGVSPLTVNGRDVNIAQTSQDGYALITREWKTGDILGWTCQCL